MELEGFGFLRGANNLVLLLESSPAAEESGCASCLSYLGSAGTFLSRSSSSSSEEERIQGRPGSQGGGEVFVSAADGPHNGKSGEGREPRTATAVAADEMLRAYGDSFDVVACGGHSMDLVADFVRHFVGASPPDDGAAAD